MVDQIAKFYSSYPYPNINKYNNVNLLDLYDKSFPPDDRFVNKKICIAGCGTLQPLLIGNTHRYSYITAVDVSETSLQIARELCNRHNIDNVSFILSEFEKIDKKYDVILSTGVIHHTKDVSVFLNRCYDNLVPGGILKGFVYYISGRTGIRELSSYFISNNFSINDVRNYFTENNNNFFESQNKEDEEIADVWLNPRFREYTMDSFYQEINNSEWKGYPVKFHVLNNIKLYFELVK